MKVEDGVVSFLDINIIDSYDLDINIADNNLNQNNNESSQQKNLIDTTQINKTIKERWDRISNLSTEELKINEFYGDPGYMLNKVKGFIEGSNSYHLEGPTGVHDMEYLFSDFSFPNSEDNRISTVVNNDLFKGENIIYRTNISAPSLDIVNYDLYFTNTYSYDEEWLKLVFSAISNVLYEETLMDYGDVNVTVNFRNEDCVTPESEGMPISTCMTLVNGSNCVYNNIGMYNLQ